MKRDYAKRSTSNKSAARPASRKPRKAAAAGKKTQRPLTSGAVTFNAPSFSAGLILGGLVVLLLPQLFLLFEPASGRAESTEEQPAPKLVYQYDTLLTEGEVQTDPSAYDAEFNTTGTYLLQAASFRSFAQAARLQQHLVEQNLPATVSTQMVNDQEWYRVTVGPFERKRDGNRAENVLQENNLAPTRLKWG